MVEKRTRRSVLAATTGTVSIVLAGCTGDGNSSGGPETIGNTSESDFNETEEESGESTETETGTDEIAGVTGDEAVNAELEPAVEALNDNDDIIEEYGRQVIVYGETEHGSTPFQPLDDVESNYETAIEHLDSAADVASEEDQDVIETYRTVAEVQYEVWVHFESLDDFFDCEEQAQEYLYEEDFEAANDQTERCISYLDDAEDQLSAVGDAYDEEAMENASEFDTLDQEFNVNELEEIREQMNAVRTISEMMSLYYDGVLTFETGEDHYADEEWGKAANRYAEAHDQFIVAADEMNDLIFNPSFPFEYEQDVQELQCFAEQHAVAMTHYEEAAALMEEGRDAQAQDQRTVAMGAIEECG